MLLRFSLCCYSAFSIKKKKSYLRKKKISKPVSQHLGKVLRPVGSLLTLLQSFQVYILQILQRCFLGLGQKYVCVGQEQCQGSSPQSPRTNGPHPHGEETCILEERHVWRLRGGRCYCSYDSWNLISVPGSRWAANREASTASTPLLLLTKSSILHF